MEEMDYSFFVNQRIWFAGEKKPYRVRACDERFSVCTKPMNLLKTVMYTIVDLGRGIRGTENLVFCMGFEDDEDCNDALKRLQSGESEVSRRNFVALDIVRLDAPTLSPVV